MLNFQGDHIYLRALERSDLEFLYVLENTTEVWEISGTLVPYSKTVLKLYLEHAMKDIHEVKQLRLVICAQGSDEAVGSLDLFDYDPVHRRAGLGIVIARTEDRGRGWGGEAISLMLDYAFGTLEMKQVYANILAGNDASKYLFEKLGFTAVGIKKDWIRFNGTFKDEILYQKINDAIH